MVAFTKKTYNIKNGLTRFTGHAFVRLATEKWICRLETKIYGKHINGKHFKIPRWPPN
jgi:hypothetical protein